MKIKLEITLEDGTTSTVDLSEANVFQERKIDKVHTSEGGDETVLRNLGKAMRLYCSVPASTRLRHPPQCEAGSVSRPLHRLKPPNWRPKLSG